MTTNADKLVNPLGSPRVHQGSPPIAPGGVLPRSREWWPEDALHDWKERVAIILEAEPTARRERVVEVEDVAEALVRQQWMGR
jgi:hypothetical protein